MLGRTRIVIGYVLLTISYRYTNSLLLSGTWPEHSMMPSSTRSLKGFPSPSSMKERKGATDSGSFEVNSISDIKRIFCLSDLHTDNAENMKWLEDSVSSSDLCTNDLVIVAGDISHEFSVLEDSLKIILAKCHVAFIPGNHEAWIDKRVDKFNSLEKLERVCQNCREIGCYVDPILIDGKHPTWIVPLQSWYDGSLSFDETLCGGFQTWPWVDFARCVWPEEFCLEPLDSPNSRIPKGLAEYYINSNHDAIEFVKDNIKLHQSRSADEPVSLITFSHFLPNQQCLPDWKILDSKEFDTKSWLNHGAGTVSAKFAKVGGSSLLDQQLRQILNDDEISNVRHLHVFGHSHRPKDFDYEGIRYIHNPLGKPREREMYMVSPRVNFKLIWSLEDEGEVKSPQIIRMWEEEGSALYTKKRKGL